MAEETNEAVEAVEVTDDMAEELDAMGKGEETEEEA